MSRGSALAPADPESVAAPGNESRRRSLAAPAAAPSWRHSRSTRCSIRLGYQLESAVLRNPEWRNDRTALLPVAPAAGPAVCGRRVVARGPVDAAPGSDAASEIIGQGADMTSESPSGPPELPDLDHPARPSRPLRAYWSSCHRRAVDSIPGFLRVRHRRLNHPPISTRPFSRVSGPPRPFRP